MSEPATPFPGGAVNRRRANRGTLGGAADRKVERPAPLRQAVYEALIELIVNRTLQPGQHLVEIELAEYLGVSRQPVREALQRLQTEGWVDLRPAQGAFVHTPTEEEADQLLSVRSVLETHSAKLAAEHATPEEVEMLRDLQGLGVAALKARDVDRLVSANADLHSFITTLSRNDVLAELIGLVDRRVRWYYTPIAGPRGEDAWAEHEQLIDAIAAGDAAEASRIMTVHTERTRLAYHEQRQARASS
ncbi:GntR family transcriptional regulator [Kutzneria buriramensis]|uniref:DNA-binding GntR family transcriptional regulator n=1 Tax=Kutzneria buriramensis TaxID=1045776 RepID=A0A3E0I5V9_9PSEU|nr:GntR family transcriptional regulator [Kutzneria buriramensis]REH53916.1 DNA-binding GntR family transcriptional regulator [Kutzneria buriramensis]